MRASLPVVSLLGITGLVLGSGNGCSSGSTSFRPADAGHVADGLALPGGGAGGSSGGSGAGGVAGSAGTGGGPWGGSGGSSVCDRCDASPGDSSRGGAGGMGEVDARAVDALGGGGKGGGGGGGSAGVDGLGADGTAVSVGPSCPGADQPPAGLPLCRTFSDCPRGYDSCQQNLPVSTTGGCGPVPCTMPGQGPQHACDVDTDCGAGKVCVSKPVACCSLLEYDCVAVCTATSCAEGERCGSTGRCEPRPCGDGFACAAGLTCAPSRSGADPHGCAPVLCTDGYGCPTGTRCQTDGSKADGHGCVPIPCTDGYTCPGNLACVPTAASPDGHGCAVVTCAGACQVNQVCTLTYGVSAACTAKICKADTDCDCGVCINSAQGIYGSCAPRMSVCVSGGRGGAVGSAGGYYGGGGGVTGSGGVIDGGSGSGGHVVDSGAGGAGGNALDVPTSSSDHD